MSSDRTTSAIGVAERLADPITMTPDDRLILRELAQQVAELAAQPIEHAKRALWYAHNALSPTRPLIFCDPENGWNEIIRQADLRCESQLAREWEMRLRKEIFWGRDMQDDRVIQPYFDVPHVYTETDWGLHETRIGGQHGGSYAWDAPIKSGADLDQLRFPHIEVDVEATRRILTLAQETLGDILTVRLKTNWWWTLGLTQTAVFLRGLQSFLLDMIDEPEMIHRLMAFLRDGTLARLDFLEQHGLLSLNNDGTYVGSGGFGWTRELPQADYAGQVRTQDLWGFAESQETVGVSPAMFEEFVFQYQLPILERFGLNCYGCCEALDTRWRVVKKTPRLRRVSMSPWANVPVMAEQLGPYYIFSWKPNPADLAMPTFDEERIRAGLRAGLRELRRQDCRVEIIMKDNHTIANDPSRVVRWTRIAREEAERW
ncbi:MAG: hypothetical protein RMN25_00565 [Anaerolineae bacterium]|nr:hypothetical protein [Thermoflexales bacterium]MDW8406247.1 hypothetical protein [Anaerolineae bacterium]